MTAVPPAWTIARRAALAALAVPLIAACAPGARLPAEVRSAGSDPFAIEWVHAYAGTNGIAVNGTVHRPAGSHGTIPGSIEVAAHLADGSVIAARQVRWGPLPRRGSRRASFTAQLPVDNPAAVRSVTARYVAPDGPNRGGGQPSWACRSPRSAHPCP